MAAERVCEYIPLLGSSTNKALRTQIRPPRGGAPRSGNSVEEEEELCSLQEDLLQEEGDRG